MGQDHDPFHGAKLALFIGDALAVILRDDLDTIPWPAHWDFPGGGREGQEAPLACALRETYEELGLRVADADVVWGRRFKNAQGWTWFFVAHLPDSVAADIILGDEGQYWALKTPVDYCAEPNAIPFLAARLRLYLSEVAP